MSSNKLLYTYTRTGVETDIIGKNHEILPSTYLNTYSSSIIFDTNRRSIYTQGKEFAYATHIAEWTYVSAEANETAAGDWGLTYVVQNLGNNSEGALTYKYTAVPSKKYVDNLIHRNDAMRYCGTWTSNETDLKTGTDPNPTTPDGSTLIISATKTNIISGKNGVNGFVHNTISDPTDIAHTLIDGIDVSRGAIYKVTNSGWFGNRWVTPGDYIIANTDNSSLTNGEHWDIIQENIHLQNLKNNNNSNQIITNIQLDSEGALTYTYHDTSTNTYTQHVQTGTYSFIVNGTGIADGNSVLGSLTDVTYRNTNNYKSTNEDKYKNRLSLGSTDRVLTGVTLNHNGVEYSITYQYTGIPITYSTGSGETYTNKNHLYIEGLSLSQNSQIVTNVLLNANGEFTYTYLDATTLCGEKTYDATYCLNITTDTPDIVICHDLSYSVITNISQASNGKITYTHANINTYHWNNSTGETYTEHNSENTETGPSVSGASRIITNIELKANGELTYTYLDATTLHGTRTYDSTENTTAIPSDIILSNSTSYRFITNVSQAPNGKITYTYANISTIAGSVGIGNTYTEHNIDNPNGTSTENNNRVITNICLNGNGGLTYTYLDSLTQIGEDNISSWNTIGANPKTPTAVLGNNTAYTFISNITQHSNGKITYTYANINTYHWTSAGVGEAPIIAGNENNNINRNNTYISVVTGVNLDSDGHLTYTYTPLSHGDANVSSINTYTAYVDDIDNDNLAAIKTVTVDTKGHFVTYTSTNNIDKVDGYHISVVTNLTALNNETIYFYIGS